MFSRPASGALAVAVRCHRRVQRHEQFTRGRLADRPEPADQRRRGRQRGRLPLTSAANKFAAQGSLDAMVVVSASEGVRCYWQLGDDEHVAPPWQAGLLPCTTGTRSG